jgi:Rhodopirellula transposase DDE domain
MDALATYTQKYAQLLPVLDERTRRLVVAADAKLLGYGGIELTHQASGLDRKTIATGLRELEAGLALPGARVRQKGGGRKKLMETDPTVLSELRDLVADASRGDPDSPLQWTNKSTRTLATDLTRRQHPISYGTVATLLTQEGYRLQANRKTREGAQHPDRDAQFHYISQCTKQFLARRAPVLSVDTKKKELVGNFKNPGRRWLPTGKPLEVNLHDFPDPALGKAVPYGVYEIGTDRGYVNVGITHDTGEFAVASIRRWWEELGQERYRRATRLLITADAGGSNGYRLRLWKKELQRFADDSGLTITVCHFPPGTSKWNQIEHRLFSFISINWQGRPLTSYEVIVNLITATRTKTGLKVYAVLDAKQYPLRQKVSDAEMRTLRIKRHDFHGEWNYTISPRHK